MKKAPYKIMLFEHQHLNQSKTYTGYVLMLVTVQLWIFSFQYYRRFELVKSWSKHELEPTISRQRFSYTDKSECWTRLNEAAKRYEANKRILKANRIISTRKV